MVADGIDARLPDLAPQAGVGRTSLLIAGWRALESEAIDPWFVDPVANIFLTPADWTWIDRVTQASVSTRALIARRTRYFDDALAREQHRGVRQIVLLGAGLDTRALRLGADDAAFFEIDGDEVLAFKRDRLGRFGYRCPSRFLAGDYLRGDLLPWLERHGLKRDADTCVVWEGNTMYLPEAAIVALLGRLAAGLRRFRISFDYVSPEMIARRTGFGGADRLVGEFERMGARWVSGFPDAGALAARSGLAVIDDRRMADAAPPTRFRPALSGELFRHYSVCTLGSHE